MLSHLLFGGIQDGVKSDNQYKVSFLNLNVYQGNNKYGDMITIIPIHSRGFI